MRYERALADSEHGATYLLDRGIEEATALTARLGVVDDPLPGHERFRGWLAIPYLSPSGYPLTVRFRCIQQHNHRDFGHGKYQTVSGDRTRLYNVGAVVRAGDEIHVTEGELDALVLEQVGMPAIAIPGAQSWQPHYRVLLAGFSKVWVWGDPDEAGAELVNTVTRALPRAALVRLTDGDVTDTYLARGSGFLRQLVAE